MSINGQLGRAGTRHFEAELASHLRVIDDAIAILGPSSLTQLTMRDALRAAHGMQTIGISLDNKSIVTVSHILGDAIDLVAAHPASISDQAMIHVKAIACALRRLVVGMTEGGDPRSQLSSTWSNVQALRLLYAGIDRAASNQPAADERVDTPQQSPMEPSLFAECSRHLTVVRAAADDLSRGSALDDCVRAALRSLHSLKGSAAVAGYPDIRESCHRSEERIQRLAATGSEASYTLVAEIRLAVEAIEELLEEDRRTRFYDLQPGSSMSMAQAVRRSAAQLRDVSVELDAVADSGDDIAAPVQRDRLLQEIDRVERIVELIRRMTSLPGVVEQHVAQPSRAMSGLDERLQTAFEALAMHADKQVDLEVDFAAVHIERAATEALFDPLLQILRNAVEHGVEPPAARIASGKPERASVLLRAFNAGTDVVIEVFDDGEGISAERVCQRVKEHGWPEVELENGVGLALEPIFEPGFSLRDDADERAGRGIGLDVVRNTIRRLGGDVVVASTLGIGTCFRLTIPTVQADESGLGQHSSAGSDAEHGARPRTALVVDDSVGVRRVLGQTLQRHGWRTVQARDGAEALRYLDAGLPDVLVTDIEMPALDGYGLVRAIRQRSAWANLPIVVMTSRISDARSDSLAAIGANAYLGKPFDERDLLAALGQATEQTTARQPEE